MKSKQFYCSVIKAIVCILLIVLLCRFTMGAMAVLITIVGLGAALMKKPAVMAFCFIMFPLMVVFNSAILGMTGITLLVAKFAFCSMAVAAFVSGMGGKSHRDSVPIGWLSLYISIACLSSLDGWMPMISYLKIVNYSIMLLGIYLLTKQMQSTLSCLVSMRVLFMAMSVIMIIGSVIVYFLPSIGYSMTIIHNAALGNYISVDDLLASGNMVLFCGMTSHSQMLSPVVSCLATWVLCDMLLIERRASVLHCIILLCVPFLLYISRSRGGLLMLVAVLFITYVVTIPKSRLPQQVKTRLYKGLFVVILLFVGLAIVSQIKDKTISRWIRKTDDVSGDTRSLKDAFTGSRQFLVEANMRDFALNPLLGKGFQVVEGMKQAYQAKRITWFSASIEKGVTPYVILGETGILGAIAFLIFLCSFYLTCFKRGYMSLLTNFSCFLVANLADSTFFSPSGLGGFMWMVACIGAFSTDCLAKQLNGMNQLGEFYEIYR